MADVIAPRWAWEPYRPSPQSPWDIKKVGHLYRRAAFGANGGELEAGLAAGPDRAIDRLLKGGAGQEDFDKRMAPLAERIARTDSPSQAQAWWVYRMLYTPHPLREKLTLFWHNHFATSNAKVNNAGFMLGQYALMYRYALGSFRDLLKEMSFDPAMMIWLDTSLSQKGKPNENYARELMELFSLGIGNYTEQDIREAARAFTGWEVKDGKAAFDPSQYDDGEKTVLGQKGPWKGEDIVRICLEQKSAPYFITRKLFHFLISDTLTPTPELLAPLAEQYRQSGYDTGTLVATMLRSNLFFSPEAYRSCVKPPVDFAVSIIHALEGQVGTPPLPAVLEEMGQNIFYPPSVKGWDGGPSWINGQTLLFRQNLALALTSTEDSRFGDRADPATLAKKRGQKTDAELVDFFLRLFLQGDVPAASREHLLKYLQQARQQPVPPFWTEQDKVDHRTRNLCHLVLTMPEFQLN